MKKLHLFLLIIIFEGIGFQRCNIDTKTYPDIPSIEFKEVKTQLITDELDNQIKRVTLTFYLIDGDGDMGLNQEDTLPPYVDEYRYNFFPTLYIYKNNEFVVDTSITVSNYRIPYVGNPGQDPTLKADIIVDFDYNTSLLPYDTVFYSFFVCDRSLNKSNVAWSDTIVFSKSAKR